MMRTDAFPANDAAASLSGMPPLFLMSVRAASGCPVMPRYRIGRSCGIGQPASVAMEGMTAAAIVPCPRRFGW